MGFEAHQQVSVVPDGRRPKCSESEHHVDGRHALTDHLNIDVQRLLVDLGAVKASDSRVLHLKRKFSRENMGCRFNVLAKEHEDNDPDADDDD